MVNRYTKIYTHLLVLAISSAPFFVYADGLVPCDGTDCNVSSLVQLVQKILELIGTIAPFIAAALFAWGGILYMTAQGDSGKISNAHKLFGYAVLGLIITLAAWLIVYAIMKGLNVGSDYWFLNNS